MQLPVDTTRLLFGFRATLAALVALNPQTGGLSPYLHYTVALLAYPTLFRCVLGIRLTARETAVVAIALFLHPVAVMYGIYDALWWFDHLTHALSAMVVASIGFILVEAANRRASTTLLTPQRQYAVTIVFVLVMGVIWEIYEMYEVQYLVLGPYDTATDLVFDIVGGVIAVVFGADYLRSVTSDVDEHLERILTKRT